MAFITKKVPVMGDLLISTCYICGREPMIIPILQYGKEYEKNSLMIIDNSISIDYTCTCLKCNIELPVSKWNKLMDRQ